MNALAFPVEQALLNRLSLATFWRSVTTSNSLNLNQQTTTRMRGTVQRIADAMAIDGEEWSYHGLA